MRTGIEYSRPSAKAPVLWALCAGTSWPALASSGTTLMPQLLSSCTTSSSVASAAAAAEAARALTAASELKCASKAVWSFPHRGLGHPGLGLISMLGKKSFREE